MFRTIKRNELFAFVLLLYLRIQERSEDSQESGGNSKKSFQIGFRNTEFHRHLLTSEYL